MEDLPSLVDVELLGLVPADCTVGVEGVRVVRMHRVDAPRHVDTHNSLVTPTPTRPSLGRAEFFF